MVCLQTMPQLANLLVRARILHLKRWLPHRVRLELVDKEELANGLPSDDAAAGKSVGQGQNPPPQALAATQSPAKLVDKEELANSLAFRRCRSWQICWSGPESSTSSAGCHTESG